MIPHLAHGFHGLEHDEGGEFVWSKHSFAIDRQNRDFAVIELCYHGENGALLLHVEDDKPLRLPIQYGWQEVPIDLRDMADSCVHLQVSPPVSEDGDARELGVMIRRVVLHDDGDFFHNLNRVVENARLNQREFKAGAIRMDSVPVKLRIDIEGRCNIKPPCVYCSWDFDKNAELQCDFEWSFENIKALGNFERLAQEVHDCSIGEPFLNRELGQVFDRWLEHGKKVGLTTNGQVLNEKQISSILGKRVSLYFSLDASTAEGYAQYRNSRFDKVVETIARVADLRKPHDNLPRILVACLAMKSNFGDVENVMALASAAGADAFVVRSLFEDARSEAPVAQPHAHDFNYDDEVLSYENIQHLTARLEDKSRSLGIQLINDLETFSAPQSDGSQPMCSEPWNALYVLRRGISPCCYSSATPVGYWNERGDRSIEEFVADTFNGDAMQDIRASLARGELADFCQNTASCPFLKRRKPDKVTAPND